MWSKVKSRRALTKAATNSYHVFLSKRARELRICKPRPLLEPKIVYHRGLLAQIALEWKGLCKADKMPFKIQAQINRADQQRQSPIDDSIKNMEALSTNPDSAFGIADFEFPVAEQHFTQVMQEFEAARAKGDRLFLLSGHAHFCDAYGRKVRADDWTSGATEIDGDAVLGTGEPLLVSAKWGC